MTTRWTQAELAILCELYAGSGGMRAALAALPDRSADAIRNAARQRGIRSGATNEAVGARRRAATPPSAVVARVLARAKARDEQREPDAPPVRRAHPGRPCCVDCGAVDFTRLDGSVRRCADGRACERRRAGRASGATLRRPSFGGAQVG